MSFSSLVNDMWDMYGYKPSEREKILTFKWAEDLQHQSVGVLERVLDSAEHPRQQSGQRMRPNLATLQDIARRVMDQDNERRSTNMSEAEHFDCGYCDGTGLTIGYWEQESHWYTGVRGRCSCKAGHKFPRLKFEKTQTDVLEYARKVDVHCDIAAYHIARFKNADETLKIMQDKLLKAAPSEVQKIEADIAGYRCLIKQIGATMGCEPTFEQPVPF